MKYYIIICLFLLSCMKNAEVNNSSKINWKQIEQISYPQDKPIIIYFSYKGCQPCEKINSTTLSNNDIAYRFNTEFIPVLISDLYYMKYLEVYSNKYKVDNYPTFIGFYNDKEISRMSGYQDYQVMSVYIEATHAAFQVNKMTDVAQQLINVLEGKRQ